MIKGDLPKGMLAAMCVRNESAEDGDFVAAGEFNPRPDYLDESRRRLISDFGRITIAEELLPLTRPELVM